MENEKVLIDLLEVAKALWKKAWAIVLAAAIFGGGMFAFKTHTNVPQYTTKAILYTSYQQNQEFDIDGNTQSISQYSLDDSRALVSTCISLSKTRMFLNEVIQTAGLNLTTAQLSSMIHVQAVDKTELFTITVTADNAEKAALIANTVSEILPEKVTMINANSHVGIIDNALTPTSPNGNDIVKTSVQTAFVGAFLVCCIIAVLDVTAQYKKQKAQEKQL